MIVEQRETIQSVTISVFPSYNCTNRYVQTAICPKNSAHTEYKQGLNGLVNFVPFLFFLFN